MSTPDRRARDKDRDAAIEIVEAAWADGQIVEADRDHRVESLLQAHTVAEVDMLVRDLQAPPAVVTATAAPPGLYGVPEEASPKVARVAPLVVLIVVLAILGAGAAGLVAVVSGLATDGSDATSGSDRPAKVADVLSGDGFGELLAGIEAETGSTEAFEAVLYPTYAVVYLPVDRTSQRYSYWYWNGVLDDLDSRGTSTYERYDLGAVDPAVVLRLVKRARGLVEDPTSWYAIVRAPDGDGAAIWAYASNEYSESEYLAATLAGKVVHNSARQ